MSRALARARVQLTTRALAGAAVGLMSTFLLAASRGTAAWAGSCGVVLLVLSAGGAFVCGLRVTLRPVPAARQARVCAWWMLIGGVVALPLNGVVFGGWFLGLLYVGLAGGVLVSAQACLREALASGESGGEVAGWISRQHRLPQAPRQESSRTTAEAVPAAVTAAPEAPMARPVAPISPDEAAAAEAALAPSPDWAPPLPPEPPSGFGA